MVLLSGHTTPYQSDLAKSDLIAIMGKVPYHSDLDKSGLIGIMGRAPYSSD